MKLTKWIHVVGLGCLLATTACSEDGTDTDDDGSGGSGATGGGGGSGGSTTSSTTSTTTSATTTSTGSSMLVDECSMGTDDCDDNATCTDLADGFECTCNTGYSGDGVTCTDDDECTLMTDNCDVNATCNNTPGGFACACVPPYVGNGVVCMLPPPGETCGTPKVVGALPYSDTDDSGLYTDEYETGGGCPSDGGDNGLGASDVVYAFTPTTTDTYGIAINKTGSSGPSLVYVTTDCANILNACIGDSGDIWGATNSSFGVPMTSGVTYYIVVDGWFGTEDGTYTLDILAPQPEICTDSIDNDFNGDTDCDDVACAADPTCTPVESLVGCDPTYCTFTAAAGPNGGDLCSCTFPGGNHPAVNDLTSTSACSFFGDGADMVMSFDVTAYSAFSITTCGTPGDSSLAVYDANPATVPPELYCSSDASGESSYCSEIGDSGASGPPTSTPKPAGNTLWIQVDEYATLDYWDGATARTIDVELIP